MNGHEVELMVPLEASHAGKSLQEIFNHLTENKLGQILKTAGPVTHNCMKFAHYLPVYQDLFIKYVSKQVRMLEIGVQHGGSYRLWSNFFGPDLLAWTGVDIEAKCLHLNEMVESSKGKVFHGSQCDPSFLKGVEVERGPFDIVIDDGSHCVDHIISSFESLAKQIKPGGLYVIEDVHASYWSGFRGSGPKLNIVSYFQGLLHSLNSQALRHQRRSPDIQPEEMVKPPAPICKIEFLPSMIICHMGSPSPLIEWKAGGGSVKSD